VVQEEFIFYPYRNGRLAIESESQLAKQAPWFYESRLVGYKGKLEERKSLRQRKWWELVEPRTTWMEKKIPRILSTAFGYFGSFAYDEDGSYAVVQGSAWFWKGTDASDDLLLAYLALLNSYEFESLLGLLCPQVGGGQYQLYEADLRRVPLPDLSRQPILLKKLAECGRRIVKGNGLEPIIAGALTRQAYGADNAFRSVPRGKIGALQLRFDELANDWRRTRGHAAKVRDLTDAPAYQDIIEMGDPAVAFLLRELRDRPDHWFTALREITELQISISPEKRGQLSAMANAWLNWGLEERRY
jgi:hypothetical protein